MSLAPVEDRARPLTRIRPPGPLALGKAAFLPSRATTAATPLLSLWLYRFIAAWASGGRNDRHSLVGIGRLGSHARIDIARRFYGPIVALQFFWSPTSSSGGAVLSGICGFAGDDAAATVVKSIDRSDRRAFSSGLVSPCAKPDIRSIVPIPFLGRLQHRLAKAARSLAAHSGRPYEISCACRNCAHSAMVETGVRTGICNLAFASSSRLCDRLLGTTFGRN